MKRNIAPLFPTIVVGYENENYLDMNTKLLKLLDKEEFYPSKYGYDPEQTKDNHLENREEYSEFFSWVQTCLDDYKEHFGLMTEGLRVSLSWANKSTQYTEHRRHYHPNSYISGIYYITDKPSPTYFDCPVTVKRTGVVVVSQSILDHNVWTCPSATGELVLFPSWLEHYTEPQPFEGNRYTLSINVMPVGITNKNTLIECVY